MSWKLLDNTHFKKIILDEVPIIDVRAPIEFAEGSIPNSVNLPIMNNEERAAVGTAYKKQGQEAAIALGMKLVSREIKKQRVEAWIEFIKKNPNAIITCFRGGLRSKISQEWLAEAGFERPRIEGGYKAFRQFLISEIEDFVSKNKLLVVSGATGSGKTILLRDLAAKNDQSLYPILDLEKIANHRGSAFGRYETPQPTQINFENELAKRLIQISKQQGFASSTILVEDESRLVGVRALPESLFTLLRSSDIVLIEESIEVRTENTYNEYVLNAGLQSSGSYPKVFQLLKEATIRITKKLGGARTQEIMNELNACEDEYSKSGELGNNKVWIRKLLEWYYDPMYLGSIDSRNPNIKFRGTRSEVFNYLTKK